MIEYIKCILDTFKGKHSNIPWGKIVGFRNGIVHEYGETDYTIIYEIVIQDLEELKSTFFELI